MAARLAVVPDSPRRATALVRVSKARGRDDLISPELQRHAIADYAQAHGIDVVEWVEVLDQSASADRSRWWRTLDRAVEQVEARDRDVVLVWKFSRAARHRRRWAVALDRIEVAGGTLESATEGLDTTTSTGRLARGMLAELSTWESEVKGEQWRETLERRRRNGLPHTGQRRFGYTYSRETGYLIDPETAPLLAEAYRRYLAGDGHTTLARWFNQTGIPSMRGSAKGWSVQAMIVLLDGGFGAGLIHRKSDHTWTQGAHEPVIDTATWEAYQRTRRLRWDLPARVRTPAYLLTGLVKCGLCGYAMVASSTAKQGPGYMYRCTAKISGQRCPGLWITRSRLEDQVRDWLAEQVAAGVEERAASRTARSAAAATARMERRALLREMDGYQGKLERARGFLLDGTLTRDEYTQDRARIDARTDEIRRLLDRLEVTDEQMRRPLAPQARRLLKDWGTLSVADSRAMLAEMIVRVEVHPPPEPGLAKEIRVVVVDQ